MRYILGFLTLCFLASCGGNVKELACSGENWAQLGYKIGSEGKSVHEFDAYRTSCGEKLQKGALKSYLDGYTRGIVEFCTYDKVYALGAQNLPMSQHCPAEVQTAFANGYKMGKIFIKEKISRLEKMTRDDQIERNTLKSGLHVPNNNK